MISPADLKDYFVLLGVFLVLGIPVSAQGKPQDKKIDIFVDGKRYDSYKDYKKFKIEKMKEDAQGDQTQSVLHKESSKSEESKKEVSQDELSQQLCISWFREILIILLW